MPTHFQHAKHLVTSSEPFGSGLIIVTGLLIGSVIAFPIANNTTINSGTIQSSTVATTSVQVTVDDCPTEASYSWCCQSGPNRLSCPLSKLTCDYALPGIEFRSCISSASSSGAGTVHKCCLTTKKIDKYMTTVQVKVKPESGTDFMATDSSDTKKYDTQAEAQTAGEALATKDWAVGNTVYYVSARPSNAAALYASQSDAEGSLKTQEIISGVIMGVAILLALLYLFFFGAEVNRRVRAGEPLLKGDGGL